VEKENILEGKIDSLMRRLETMEIEKKEAQDLKAAEARSTCEECGEYGHVRKYCALQVPTYSRHFEDILANKYDIATLRVDHVKMSEECSAAIANGLEKQKDPGALQFHVPLVLSTSRRRWSEGRTK
jgi:hypothetical protein